jgi:hypothetical protein
MYFASKTERRIPTRSLIPRFRHKGNEIGIKIAIFGKWGIGYDAMQIDTVSACISNRLLK